MNESTTYLFLGLLTFAALGFFFPILLWGSKSPHPIVLILAVIFFVLLGLGIYYIGRAIKAAS